uniref:DEAD/DEAH box helicase n=1 Tax=Clostridium sp. TaxID=1506 RepID=UPI0026384258
KIEFYIIREDNNLYCNFKINYINSLEALKDNKFLDKIDMVLERYSFIKDNEKDGYKFIGNEEDEYLFLKEGLNKLKALGNLKLEDKFKEIKVLDNNSIHMEFREEDEEYYLKYSIDNIGQDEIGTIVNKANKGERFYKSKDGNFLDLENPEVKKFINILRELNFFKTVYKEDLPVDKYQIFHLGEKIMGESSLDIRGKEVFKDIIEKFKNKEENYEAPMDLKGTLRDYQVKGYNWLNEISDLGLGGILADDMGLGKTIQTIALILKNKDKKTLIIAPTALIYNWKNEFDKFTKGLNIGILHGNLKDRNKVKENFENYNIILTTYGTLKNDYDFYKDKTFDYIILDEAQNIKNSKAKTTEIVKDIKGKCKIALTGTPIENNLLELWSIFDFVMPGFLYREDRFKIEFLNGKEESIKELKALISPFILRRLKSEVLDELPDKIEKEYLVPMTNMQKQIYNSYLKEFKKDIKESSDNKIVIFSYLTKLRQLCLDPSLIIEEYKEESAKIKLVKDILIKAKENNKKVILFSQFTSVLKKIGGKLEKENLEYLYLDGSVKAKDRVNLVNEFNGGNTNIFLISLKSGGVGLNLTSANMVIHFDPWWNPAVQNQATDRAYRIGQKNVVEVIKLISKDTIEEKIMKLQKEKQELIRNIIDEGNLTGETISSLSKEELINLFD